MQLECVYTFGAKMPARAGRFGIAFDGDQLAMLVINNLSAAHATIRIDGRCSDCAVVLGAQVAHPLRHGFCASTSCSSLNLLNEGPTRKQINKHDLPP